ncbi:PspC domain-containing protein [Bradyrhizobium erythrophlei]|uniref:Phage shock protein C (PspC) family protein n=1 Tax=Bradyrhizobium erythrophlei TaxID=1437360 RepID=A0A1H4ULZ2_9BRAD|nr:PspC domain-containing protein [Bradyrhizobium erythrophlei]SEC69291.1 phage shock protein C (PspC) family protein [Bradyrhizobium erythrophlei]
MNMDRPYLPLVYRDSSTGWVTGVCAGLSEITGVRPVLLRASTLLSAYMFPLVVVPAYLIAFALLRDRARMESSDLDDVTLAPVQVPSADEHDLLQQRLAHIEAEVTSGDAELRRRFRDAGLA